MTLKQAIKIVESHNRWRRDNNVPPKTKMASPAELGEALDVLLIVARDYTTIYNMDRVNIKPKLSERTDTAIDFSTNDLDNNKLFYHESNADEYWKNKRLFSYNDIEKYQSGGEGVFYDVKAIAKRRSER